MDLQIARQLNDKIKVGFYTRAYLKQIINEIYTNLEIKAKGKATDITKWFDAEPNYKRVDGKVTKGYMIYRPLFSI